MINRAAVTIYADFEAIETTHIKLGEYMEAYPKGDIARLDILKDALYDLEELYKSELENMSFSRMRPVIIRGRYDFYER